ncbi:DnaD family protein [Mycoplasma mycoides]|uniref:DnaD family protein n=1 Tax=Mycoplasma mycoides TaxID=2102 RepID=UPI002736BB25|nr:DnaD family protein [Mycoplasma mycoides]MDP4040037.1 DnaD family protein [Mycoplasma mycoides]MDP4040999.1 DnaD family protein [Mycoplasma mycoides]MDP4041798.1 DnaD family protein [Mycoplasma mycoides]MDP4043424.1 DnaD family protein [Mycoplasma mycoides]MDP4044291.1 DnaD family protein [Mycoplasma mycoides]
MILKMLEKGIISKKKLLLEYYKKLNLTDNQALIILMIMYLNDQTRKMTTPNLLANYLNLSSVEIEKELELLAEKDLIEIKSDFIDFSNLFQKIGLLVNNSFLIEQNITFFNDLEKNLLFSLTENQKLKLLDLLKTSIKKEQVLQLSINKKLFSFEELLKEVEIFLKSTNKFKQFDWLDDQNV